MKIKKKLIEVALPLEAINEEGSRRKRKAPSGFPTTLHKWWAQRPLAAARAVIFAQLVDDPSELPDLFPTVQQQSKERERLFRIIEELVRWENTNNVDVITRARDEIWQSWRRACALNADDPRAKELFCRTRLPRFFDPFAGSGAIPLEAQRLGLETYASDLNPVAVLINFASIEVPPRFFGQRPINPSVTSDPMARGTWQGAIGLAEDVRYYGEWVRREASKRVGHLYPSITLTEGMIKGRSDLVGMEGQELPVVAWLWVRTILSPNPAFSNVHVPLASTFYLSTKDGRQSYVEPVVDGASYHFEVRVGAPADPAKTRAGTKRGRGSTFTCILSDTPIDGEYIKSEAQAGRMGVRLMAIVAEGRQGRVYLAPTAEHEEVAQKADPQWVPDLSISGTTQYLGVKPYGMERFDQLFTRRQLVIHSTLADLVQEVRELVQSDATSAGLADDGISLLDGGKGARAYADAICMYLALANSRLADYGSSIATWRPKDNAMRSSLAKQALQMAWDFAEGSPFGESSSGLSECVNVVASAIAASLGNEVVGHVSQADAALDNPSIDAAVVSTDPPYYDNVPYADLSDFFYVWLRRSLRQVFPAMFSTVAVPKVDELVAFSYRHGGKRGAEQFFLNGMTKAMRSLVDRSHPGFPVTIYYAFKQSETDDDSGVVSTGWETFLQAVIDSGFAVTGTWPLRTEGDNRQRGIGANALASSIVLVCRKRAIDAPVATRRDFFNSLKVELPEALTYLQRGNVAPVDLAQAAIGPGMAIYTRYSRVLDAEGVPLSVRDALVLINQVLDESLAEQEGDFDADSRWALAWFEEQGFNEGDYGRAEQLSKSKNTSVAGMVEAGILLAKRGKVRLLKPDELPEDWNPSTDQRLTAWESVHHLIRTLGAGEQPAAELVKRLGSHAEVARELAYRLYVLCERKKRATEALAYNGLVQSWPEIVRLAREGKSSQEVAPQSKLFKEE